MDDYKVYVDLYRQVNDERSLLTYPELEQMARSMGRVVIGISGMMYKKLKGDHSNKGLCQSGEYTELCPRDSENALFMEQDFDPNEYEYHDNISTVEYVVVIGPGPL